MKLRLLLCLFATLFICLVTGNAFAQADKSGLELRAGIQVPYFMSASAGVNDSGSELQAKALGAVGVGVGLQVLYRWKYFGIGIEQGIGGVFATADYGTVSAHLDGQNTKSTAFKKGEGAFLGATYLILKQYIPITQDAMITLGQGVGAMYGAKLKNKQLFITDSDAAFAFKGELGFVYFILSQHGVGINIEYAGALAIKNGISFAHAVTPALTYTMIF